MEIKVKVQTPSTPNYIMVGRESVSIKEFTEEQLREIGAECVNALVTKAEQLRNEPQVLTRKS
jgi:hypothetical protein